jgi:hypothetical protein
MEEEEKMLQQENKNPQKIGTPGAALSPLLSKEACLPKEYAIVAVRTGALHTHNQIVPAK